MSRPKSKKNKKKLQKFQGKSLKTRLVSNTPDHTFPLPSKSEDVSSNWRQFIKTASLENPLRSAVKKVNNGTPGEHAVMMDKCADGIIEGCSCRPRPQVWFDGVDPELLERDGDNSGGDDLQLCSFCRRNSDGCDKKPPQLSRYVAMDCEMVGVGSSGFDNALARVSIVNALGQPVYDKYVRPKEKVTDYRTAVSGIRPEHLRKAAKFEFVQREVHDIIRGRVLVGHALHNDLRVLLLSHPRRYTRDTANYKPFRRLFNGRIPSLKNLAQMVLAVKIQSGEHDSVQDARAAMKLYQMHRREWETSLALSKSK